VTFFARVRSQPYQIIDFIQVLKFAANKKKPCGVAFLIPVGSLLLLTGLTVMTLFLTDTACLRCTLRFGYCACLIGIQRENAVSS
jgi:hypothetical protein